MSKSYFSKFFTLTLSLCFCFLYTPASYAVGWDSVANLSVTGQDATYPNIAMDPDGNGISIWQRSDGSNDIAQASRYTKSTNSWSSPVNLSVDGQDAEYSFIAMDPDGNGIAVWQRYDASANLYRIQISLYTKSTNSWSTPEYLSASTPGSNCYTPKVVMDSDGNGMVTWMIGTGSTFRIQASRYTKSTNSWSAPIYLSEAGQPTQCSKLAIDPDGNSISVWRRSDGSNLRIQASRYTKSTNSWSTPVNISTAGQDVPDPYIAMDPDGNGLVLWDFSDGSNTIIQASRYTKSTNSWSTPVNLSETGYDSILSDASVAMDSDGNGISVWLYTVTANTWKVQASRYVKASNSWSTPVDLSATGVMFSYPRIAMDPDGNGIAIWDKSDGSNYRVQTSRYVKTTNSWSTPITLSEAGQDACGTGVAMNPDDNGIAVWQRTDGSNKIAQASYYEALSAPTVYAEQILRNLATYTELINAMYWAPISDAIEYKIYFNWHTTPPLKLTTIPASSYPSFEHHLVYPCLSYSYYIVACDNQGNTSTATKVSLP